MDIQVPVIVAIISAVGVGIQFYIAERNRRQLAAQSKETLSVQRLISHRSTAAFIADKRQKWIDELRTDMAYHLAQSQEIAWKWDAVRSTTARKVLDANDDPVKVNQIQQDAADAFSVVLGELDRDHQERHIRIKFRLNPKEDLHIKLRTCLNDIREVMNKTQSAKSLSEAKQWLDSMKLIIEVATEVTEKVLKAEWQRVKQEVAYPESLIVTIPEPDNPQEPLEPQGQ